MAIEAKRHIQAGLGLTNSDNFHKIPSFSRNPGLEEPRNQGWRGIRRNTGILLLGILENLGILGKLTASPKPKTHRLLPGPLD